MADPRQACVGRFKTHTCVLGRCFHGGHDVHCDASRSKRVVSERRAARPVALDPSATLLPVQARSLMGGRVSTAGLPDTAHHHRYTWDFDTPVYLCSTGATHANVISYLVRDGSMAVYVKFGGHNVLHSLHLLSGVSACSISWLRLLGAELILSEASVSSAELLCSSLWSYSYIALEANVNIQLWSNR